MRTPRVLTVWLSSFYGRGGQAPSNEQGIFGHGLFSQLGWDEAHVPMEIASRPETREAILCATYDAIFVVPFEGIETWLRPIADKSGCPVIVWWCDNWRQKFQQAWAAAGCMDAATTTDSANAEELAAMLAPRGGHAILTNWGIRPDLWRVSPPIEQPKAAATFAGQLYGDRRFRLAEIAKAGDVPVVVRDTGRTVMSIADYHHFMASHTFALALTKSSHGQRQWKARHFEAALHGTILVTEPVERLADYWEPGVECLTFETAAEAQSAMCGLMDEPDTYLAMAERTFQRGLAEHTMHHRIAEVLDALHLPVPQMPDFAALVSGEETEYAPADGPRELEPADDAP